MSLDYSNVLLIGFSAKNNNWTKIVFGNIPSSSKPQRKSNKWVWLAFMWSPSGYKIGDYNIMSLI